MSDNKYPRDFRPLRNHTSIVWRQRTNVNRVKTLFFCTWHCILGRQFFIQSRHGGGRCSPITLTVNWKTPSPGGRNSHPYGIVATPDGAIWYCESGLKPNTFVQFDPNTQGFETWAIPSGGGVVRNMVSTRREISILPAVE
jgi:streptogramin lyase